VDFGVNFVPGLALVFGMNLVVGFVVQSSIHSPSIPQTTTDPSPPALAHCFLT
jgi:hypothetical protein